MIPTSRHATSRAHLIETSLAVIREGQTPEGAYLASPTFPTYRYSWFRDGAFIAAAMDDWGEHAGAAAFHAWVLRTLAAQLEAVGRVLPDAPWDAARALHTRYRADGTPGTDDWPNFQLDGFGTWLWSYADHLARTGATAADDVRAVVRELVAYLLALWPRPNFDCWEEHPDDVHPSTLGAVCAGLRAAARILSDDRLAGAADAVRSYLLAHGVHGGSFVKHVGSGEVDANLLWLTVPFGVVDPAHPVSRRTAARVRAELLDPEGGVHRYRADTYYGGGSWILLTAALAQDHLAVGEREEAVRLLGWIEAQATPEGHLPEQTARHLNEPAYRAEWEARWGPSASPLLWSHAAYLSLVARLEAP